MTSDGFSQTATPLFSYRWFSLEQTISKMSKCKCTPLIPSSERTFQNLSYMGSWLLAPPILTCSLFICKQWLNEVHFNICGYEPVFLAAPLCVWICLVWTAVASCVCLQARSMGLTLLPVCIRKKINFFFSQPNCLLNTLQFSTSTFCFTTSVKFRQQAGKRSCEGIIWMNSNS